MPAAGTGVQSSINHYHHQSNQPPVPAAGKKTNSMKQLLFTAMYALCTFGAKAQLTENREAKEVTKIEVASGVEVVYNQSDSLKLSVETNDPENFKDIVTEYKGTTLKIYIKDPKYDKSVYTTAKVYVSQKNVTSFTASGGAAIKTTGTTVVPLLNIHLSTSAMFVANTMQVGGLCTIKATSGSGFRGKVIADTFKGDAVKGGYIKIMGSANSATIFCSGGSLQAGRFICQKADIIAKNAASVFINTSNAIKADTDASSAITYYGNPDKTNLGSNAFAVKRDAYNFGNN